MDELAQLRNFRSGIAPPTDAIRERARRAWLQHPPAVARARTSTSSTSRRFGVRIAVALVTVSALVAVAVVAVNRVIDQRVAEIPRVALGEGVLQRVAPGQLPQNILILGTDDHAPGDVDGRRSDTMILLRVERHAAEAVWLPRDLEVEIPGQGAGRLNSAFWFGGPQLTIDTLKANFDLDVNHYVELDMAGLRDLVDELGGVRMSFAEALRDEVSGLQVEAGCVRVDGATALALARGRRVEALRDGAWQLVDLRSDLDRIRRQQELVDGFASTVRAEVDDHPRRLVGLLDAFVRHAKIDDTFDNQELLRLARVLVGVDTSKVELQVLPVAMSVTDPSTGLSPAAGSDLTLQQLGGSIAPSSLVPVAPTDGGELRPC